MQVGCGVLLVRVEGAGPVGERFRLDAEDLISLAREAGVVPCGASEMAEEVLRAEEESLP